MHDVFGVLGPGGDLPVGLDPVDQLGAAVLQRERVSVVLVQLLKQPSTQRSDTLVSEGFVSGAMEASNKAIKQ